MKTKLTFAHLAAVLLAVCCGCTSSNSGKSAKGLENTVKIGVPTKKPLKHVIEQPATIEGFLEAPLVAHISGYVDKVPADIGQSVNPGDVLAEIAVPEMQQEWQQKQALVKQARAEVDQAAATLAAAEANILTASALVAEAKAARTRADANYERWKSESVRVEKLVRDKVVDPQIADETLNQFKAAEAGRQEIDAKIQSAEAVAKESAAKRDKAKADVAASQARVGVAKADEGRLKALVDYRFIRAPFKGVVTRRNIHPGYYLQPNASGGPGVLFHIAQTDKLRIIVDIPEAEASYITKGLAAKIQAPGLKDQSFVGAVARTSETLDMKTRTLRTEIDYQNKAGKLLPGMFVNVIFEIEFASRYTLPASAIFLHADQPCCWRIVDSKAIRTPIKLGLRDGPLAEVLQMQAQDSSWQNVTGTEEIVITNLGAVRDGKEVNVIGKH